MLYILVFVLYEYFWSRCGRVVTRLAFQAEDPGSMPGGWLSHIIHLFIVYIHRIHHCPMDGDVKWRSRVSELYSEERKRTRVAVVEFHVSLYPNSVSPFFPQYARYMCENNDLNSLYSAEWS